jgi:hypothetical protein
LRRFLLCARRGPGQCGRVKGDDNGAWEPPPADSHGLELGDHARISAELAEGDRPTAEVLAAYDLDEQRWTEATRFWMDRVAADALALGVEATLAIEYSEAFAAAQDALKAPPEMTPEDYAELVVAIQRRGSPKQPLGDRRLSLADYSRLSRRFAALFCSDPRAQRRYFDTFVRLQPKPKGERKPRNEPKRSG